MINFLNAAAWVFTVLYVINVFAMLRLNYAGKDVILEKWLKIVGPVAIVFLLFGGAG